MQGRDFPAGNPRGSGGGVMLSLLADALPRAGPTREAEGTLQDRLAWAGILVPQ